MEYFIEDHLRRSTINKVKKSQKVKQKKEVITYLASTACRPCPTCCATYSISTPEYGLTIRNKFCSRRVSYRAARWERIVRPEESSIRDDSQQWKEEKRESRTVSCKAFKAFSKSAKFRFWCARAMALIHSTSLSFAYLTGQILQSQYSITDSSGSA